MRSAARLASTFLLGSGHAMSRVLAVASSCVLRRLRLRLRLLPRLLPRRRPRRLLRRRLQETQAGRVQAPGNSAVARDSTVQLAALLAGSASTGMNGTTSAAMIESRRRRAGGDGSNYLTYIQRTARAAVAGRVNDHAPSCRCVQWVCVL